MGVALPLLLLQSFEGLDPKAKLTGANQVTLSEAEVRSLRRDMQEQETLIQGYQVKPLSRATAFCPRICVQDAAALTFHQTCVKACQISGLIAPSVVGQIADTSRCTAANRLSRI